MSHMLHAVVANKEDINNLIAYEHRALIAFASENGLDQASKLKQLDNYTELPELPVIQ